MERPHPIVIGLKTYIATADFVKWANWMEQQLMDERNARKALELERLQR